MSRPPSDAATKIGRLLLAAYRGWPVIVAIISTAWATYGWMQMQFEARVESICRPVVTEALVAANTSLEERIGRKLESHFEHQQRIETRLKHTRDDLERMYWFYVGDQAASRYRGARRKELAAARARIAFDAQLRKGRTLQDALSNVLARPRH